MKTKTLFAALLTLLFVPFVMQAQVQVGTRHGIALSTISKIGDIYDNGDITSSYTGGISLLIPVKNHFSIQPELNYIEKGRKDQTTLLSTGEETNSYYKYLQIPVLVRYNIENQGSLNIFFNAGPYVSALLKNENTVKNGDEIPESSLSDTDKKPEAGIILGTGISIPVQKIKLEFDLRYDMGLTKLNNQPDDFRTKAISLTAGVRF